eukprot:COSAG01_NODE_635_length_14662_cov_12.488773_15_plen_111_part_00
MALCAEKKSDGLYYMAATERAAERDLSAPPTTQGTLPRSGQIERKVPDDRARASLTCAPARLLMVKFGHQLADHRAASTLPPEYYVSVSFFHFAPAATLVSRARCCCPAL